MSACRHVRLLAEVFALRTALLMSTPVQIYGFPGFLVSLGAHLFPLRTLFFQIISRPANANVASPDCSSSSMLDDSSLPAALEGELPPGREGERETTELLCVPKKVTVRITRCERIEVTFYSTDRVSFSTIW